MHGQVAVGGPQLGVEYVAESAAISPGPPIPDWLTEVRNHAAELLDASSAAVAEVLVSYYPSGPTIGLHRDAPVFGDVVGVSLEEFIAVGTVQPITWADVS
jgi:alkylated DNA repair dioxygenase AlkB